MKNCVVRQAVAADHPAIRAVVVEAFKGDGEANLIESLRSAGDMVLELVAVRDDKIVGHILFSRLLVIAGGQNHAAVALAPLAVRPALQLKGIGHQLVEEAHSTLAPRETLSVVLGDPSYYGRFGYSHARAAKFDSAYQCEAWQALAWGNGPETGRIVYPSAFAGL